MKKEIEHIDTIKMLNVIREAKNHSKNGSTLITEAEMAGGDFTDNSGQTEQSDDTQQDAIAITNDVKFGQNVLKTQIEAFKNEVDGGATFSNESDDETNPLVFMPSNKNLVFSGSIPSMNNLKFQYSLNDADGMGLFIWVNGLRLTDQNIRTLGKLQGHYKNWRDEWQKSGALLDMVSNK